MVFGTPNERYKPDMAANLLRDIGQDAVSSATKSLLERGVLSKHIRDPKREKPGRRLKISDAYVLSRSRPRIAINCALEIKIHWAAPFHLTLFRTP